MRKNANKIDIINSLIINHIENLKREDISRQEKEIDYLLVKESVEALIKEYKKPDDSRQRRKYIKNLLIGVYEQLYTYLINMNKYDYKILELYSMLDSLIYNWEYTTMKNKSLPLFKIIWATTRNYLWKTFQKIPSTSKFEMNFGVLIHIII